MRGSANSLEGVQAWHDAGWSECLPLSREATKDLQPFPGVYEARQKGHSFSRLCGQTSTMYIGSAEKREMAKRVKGLLRGRHVAWRRIERVKAELKADLEFRFKVELGAGHLEQELLHEYEHEHLEPPPCNHNVAGDRIEL